MIVVFFVGMPGSGKSSLAREVLNCSISRHGHFLFRHIEVSDVVRDWQKSKHNKDLNNTETESETLYDLLWREIAADGQVQVCAVSGVREAFLLDSRRAEKLGLFKTPPRVVTFALRPSIGLADTRYVEREMDEGLSYAEAYSKLEYSKDRAVVLGVPELLSQCDYALSFNKSAKLSDVAEDGVVPLIFVGEINEPYVHRQRPSLARSEERWP
jgi:hypothetical protein